MTRNPRIPPNADEQPQEMQPPVLDPDAVALHYKWLADSLQVRCLSLSDALMKAKAELEATQAKLAEYEKAK